jgi:hypothetical protein
MVERQSNAAWMVAEDASPPARLGLGHPHIDGNYRSTI